MKPRIQDFEKRPSCAWHDVVRLLVCPYFAAKGSAYCHRHKDAEEAEDIARAA